MSSDHKPRYGNYLSFGAAKSITAATAVLSESASGDGEFDAFEDLTQKLVQVPKSEIDEQREAE